MLIPEQFSGVIEVVIKTPLSATIGANIRLYRKGKGLTQKELAEKAGFEGGQSYISGVEKGSRNLSIQKLERIAEVLDQPPISFLIPRTE